MNSFLLRRLLFALLVSLAVAALSRGAWFSCSFVLQGELLPEHPEGTELCFSVGNEGKFHTPEIRVIPDKKGIIHLAEKVEFSSCDRLLLKIRSKPGKIYFRELALDGVPVSRGEILRQNGVELTAEGMILEAAEGSVLWLFPEKLSGEITLNYPLLIALSVVSFLLSLALGRWIFPDEKLEAVYFIDGIFVAVMVIFLLLPGSCVSKKSISKEENRKLAPWVPLISDGRVNSNFGRDFEAYFNDRFFLRDELLRVNQWLTTFTGTGFQRTGKVIYGKDNWYFYARNNAYRNYHNLDLFSRETLSQLADDLNFIHGLCRKTGKKLYIFIIPDKHKIYGEYFPAAEKIYPDSLSRAEQLTSFIRQHTPIPVLYFYHELHKNKKAGLLYWKNDTHWNSFGAYIAARKMVEIMRQDDPELPRILLPVSYRKIAYLGDLAYLEALEYPEVRVKRKFKVQGSAVDKPFENTLLVNPRGRGRVLFIRDSFAVQQLPFLGNVFRQMRCLWTDYVIAPEEISSFNEAETVIFQCVERLLPEFVGGVHESRKNLEKGSE